MYQGALVNVGKLINQLSRSEKARVDTETRMIELKKENAKLSDKNDKSSSAIKNLTSELSDCKKKLQNSDDLLHKVTVRSMVRVFTFCLALTLGDKIVKIILLLQIIYEFLIQNWTF